jgi:hypothetical protein
LIALTSQLFMCNSTAAGSKGEDPPGCVEGSSVAGAAPAFVTAVVAAVLAAAAGCGVVNSGRATCAAEVWSTLAKDSGHAGLREKAMPRSSCSANRLPVS